MLYYALRSSADIERFLLPGPGKTLAQVRRSDHFCCCFALQGGAALPPPSVLPLCVRTSQGYAGVLLYGFSFIWRSAAVQPRAYSALISAGASSP